MNAIDRVLNACWRLNAEAYEAQVIASGRKPLKLFTPCAKAEELMAVIREGKHIGTANELARITPCACHVGMTFAQLIDYEYDETYKLASYAGDKQTLYPKLYR